MREGPKIELNSTTEKIFALIGGTLIGAQAFEQNLTSLLIGLHITENPTNWKDNYQKVTADVDSLTLGRLLQRVKDSISFNDEELKLLQLAHEYRNHFIHRFYLESFGLMAHPRGHEQIIKELNSLVILFREADHIIEPLSKNLMLKAGMTEEQMLQYAHKAVDDHLKSRGL